MGSWGVGRIRGLAGLLEGLSVGVGGVGRHEDMPSQVGGE